MKAVVYYGDYNVKVSDFPEPPMHEDTIKIAVSYCGLCGTDIHKYNGKGGSRPVIPPVVLGHEASGIIVDMGRRVTGFHIGDRVTVDPNWSCGSCYFCQNGMSHMCENSKGVVKGFAEYICPPQENVYKIPENLPLKYASLAEPLACCLHGMDLLNVKLGDTVMIIGLGSIGSMMVQLCKSASATNIIVVETMEEKRTLATKLGATLFINPLTNDVKETLLNENIKNIDKVMECVGSKTTIENAIDYAGKCATIMLFGLADPNNPALFNQYLAFQKELTIKTSFVNPKTTGRAISLLASNAIDCESIISSVMSMSDVCHELKNLTYFKQGKVLVEISK